MNTASFRGIVWAFCGGNDSISWHPQVEGRQFMFEAIRTAAGIGVRFGEKGKELQFNSEIPGSHPFNVPKALGDAAGLKASFVFLPGHNVRLSLDPPYET